MQSSQPLAERMRPRSIEEYIGQEHLIGKKGAIRKSLDAGHIPSMILWGHTGCWKNDTCKFIS